MSLVHIVEPCGVEEEDSNEKERLSIIMMMGWDEMR